VTLSTTTTSEGFDELRKLAAELDDLDVDCYRRHGRDPLEPVLGLGAPDARWCFFGRDPGEKEVQLHKPFVGKSGQKIRAGLSEIGLADEDVFWMNTVPYKPIDNKPWSLAVVRRFQPVLLQLLLRWHGSRVIAFGEGAFRWFGLTSPSARDQVSAFWSRSDRYTAGLELVCELPGPCWRTFMLYPLPHPSGANARWAKSFPHLLRSRLTDRSSL
jgi:uracil-DNA glycosylase